MPEIPDNVPIYIASDHEDDQDDDRGDSNKEARTELLSEKTKSAGGEKQSKRASKDDADKRKSLMEDRSAGNWQPYTKEIVSAEITSAENTQAAGDSTSAAKKAEGSSSSFSKGDTLQIKRKTMQILLGITALNSLAVGLWAGNQIIPHAPVTSSIDPVLGNLFDTSSKVAPANIIADIVQKASPSVVTIDIRVVPKLAATPETADQFNNPSSEMLPNQATGVIVRSDGYILTCAHAFKTFESIDVTFDNHKTVEAKLIGKDDFTDLALIKVEAQNLPVLKFSEASLVKPGDWVVAIGSPVGLDHTVTTGVVSSARRSLEEVNNNRVELIQHDALLYIGSSGGPLLNIKGEVIGINAAVRGGTPGISFSVPADVAAEVSKELMTSGRIARPYMGMVMEDVDPNMTRSLTLPSSSVAVRVTRVEAKGPAEAAGIKAGDIVLKVKGVMVRRSQEVRTMTRDDKPGVVLDLVLKRDGQEIPVKLQLGDFAKYRPHG